MDSFSRTIIYFTFAVIIIFIIFLIVYLNITQPKSSSHFERSLSDNKKFLDFCYYGSCGEGMTCETSSLRCKKSAQQKCTSGFDCANNLSCLNEICS